MPRSPSREVYADLKLPRLKPRRGRRAKYAPVLCLCCAAALTLYLCLSLRALATAAAISEAQDFALLRIAETVRMLLAGEAPSDGFVHVQRDSEGNVSAVTADTASVNRFSSALLEALVTGSEEGEFDLRVPLGTLLGGGVLLGRGPGIPVRVGVLRSSAVRFESGFTSAGLNQTRYSLSLIAEIDLELLVPWGTERERVTEEIPIADTVIVGRVPQSWFGGAAGWS